MEEKEFDEFMIKRLGEEVYNEFKENDPAKVLDWFFAWQRNDYLDYIFCALATLEGYVTGRVKPDDDTAWAQMPKQGQIF